MAKKLPFLTLVLLISFASVNAVMFTPALPSIRAFFAISEQAAQLTLTLFLIGYALGQLVYGPIANRFGRKPALYTGIGLQIFASGLCILAGLSKHFWLLELGRFLLALGAGAGLKMTYVLVNEFYETAAASRIISYLMLAFAITPGLSVALGGFLTSHFGWMSCFYASALYGLILMLRVRQLPETLQSPDYHALKPKHFTRSYKQQFQNGGLIAGGILMGLATCFVYLFAAVAPFIAMNLYHMQSDDYGLANIIPSFGLIMGSLLNAQLTKRQSLTILLQYGIAIALFGSCIMLALNYLHLAPLFSLFMPMVLIYIGLCMILANASTLAMSCTPDKAHGSATMNFINMGMATMLVLSIGYFTITPLMLPASFITLGIAMLLIFKLTSTLNRA